MTIEGGSRRNPPLTMAEAMAEGGRVSGDIGPVGSMAPDQWVPGESKIAHWRLLDPIRKTALECAITAFRRDFDEDNDPIGMIIAIAKEFERYLTGQEAND